MAAKAVVALVFFIACMAFPTVAAAEPANVSMSAKINGQDVSSASTANPVRLEPGKSVDVAVELSNHGTEPVNVRHVELAGSVLGLTFFSYDTTVQLTVPPGATETLRYELDLVGIDGQATGLIAGAVTLTGADGHEISSIPTVTDVRGSLISVYGLFGIALVVLTALAMLDSALAIARHRLSANRWRRGLRLLAPGVGLGLVIAFSASVARLWVPNTGLWLVLAGVTAAVSFAIGYFSPTPAEDDDDDDDGDDDGDDDKGDDDDPDALADADTTQVSPDERSQ